jgi:hypothetical protein
LLDHRRLRVSRQCDAGPRRLVRLRRLLLEKVWALNTADTSDPVLLTTSGTGITAFAQDIDGELYMLGIDGSPFKLVRK